MAAPPNPNEIALARNASRSLARSFAFKKNEVKITITEEGKGIDVVLPMSAFKILINVLSEMAQGQAVTVLPIQDELTTQEAADVLNVSRPFLIKLLDENKIAHKKVGRHRRVLTKDLLEFKKAQEQAAEPVWMN